MSPSLLRAALAHHALDLRLHRGRLQSQGDRGRLPETLREALARDTPRLLAHLGCETLWYEAVREIAGRYQGRSGEIALDDVALSEAVGRAIQAGDLEAARLAIARWRTAWIEALLQVETARGPPR